MIILRALLAVVCGAATAALGALMLGEYEFTGPLPFVAGPLFGLVVAEVMLAVGQLRTALAAATAGALAFAGIAWAGWIDSTQGVEPVKGLAWVSACLAAATAIVRILGRPKRVPS
ncbi:MAG: hypothetical protein WD691_10105 [Acidimicrobiales bacterium]